MVDEAGRPVRIVLTPGQASDKAAVADMLSGLPAARHLVADRGYDARAIVDLVREHGAEPHIPTQRDRKAQRSVSAALYRERNLVERFFNRLKQFRKIATRYEQTARNYLAAIHIASSRIWLRYESAP